ncbi:MAG: ribulose-phosphate 3-epimerase [Firmicutes bacterium]|nr:ribulose-phosphate 3-epimerase [Bacillota bacterium]
MIKISPSILSADFAEMGKAVELMEKSGADYIHCDVMDGAFVPNISFGPGMIKAIKKHTSLPLDVHLMVDKPERYIDDFVNAGASIITIHAEATTHIQRVLQYIRAKGVKCGLVLNPATPVDYVKYCLDCVDMILLMSVNPGFGGQKFIPAVLPKVKEVSDMIAASGYDIELEIDGGINFENIGPVLKAGANVIVAGSTVFGHPDPAEAIRRLRG